MKNIIFYFTGTGNSYQVARDIANKLGDTELRNLARYDMSNNIIAERVGIIFPVYFWGLPIVVDKFINELELEKSTYIFALATYGIWPGKALEQAEKVLNNNKIKLNSEFFIRMPDNYILAYGARSEKLQERCFQNEKNKVEAISEIILRKENKSLEKSKYIIDRLFTNLVYNSNVKKFPTMDKKFNVNENCTNCGLCEKKCPVGNIIITNGKPVWNHHCEVCLACIQYCPAKAINYGKSTINRGRYVNPNI